MNENTGEEVTEYVINVDSEPHCSADNSNADTSDKECEEPISQNLLVIIQTMHEGYSIKILRAFGIWPRKDQINDKYFKMKAILITPVYTLLGVGNLMHMMHIIFGDGPISTELIIENVAYILATIALMYLILVFICIRKNIHELMVDLNNFARFGIPKRLEEIKKDSDRFALFYCVYCFTGVIIFVCLKYFRDSGIGLRNWIWLPFDIHYFPVQEIYVIMLIVSSSFLTCCSSGIISLLYYHSQLIIIRVEHLRDLHLDGSVSNQRLKLKTFVDYHNDIIRLMDKLNNSYGNLLFLHISIGSICIGILGYVFMLDWSIASFLHICGWIMGLIIPCYIGQQIIDQSNGIPAALYNTTWYESEIEIQKAILLMITNASVPLYLKPKGVGFMAFETFQLIMKSAYSFLTILVQTMDKS